MSQFSIMRKDKEGREWKPLSKHQRDGQRNMELRVAGILGSSKLFLYSSLCTPGGNNNNMVFITLRAGIGQRYFPRWLISYSLWGPFEVNIMKDDRELLQPPLGSHTSTRLIVGEILVVPWAASHVPKEAGTAPDVPRQPKDSIKYDLGVLSLNFPVPAQASSLSLSSGNRASDSALELGAHQPWPAHSAFSCLIILVILSTHTEMPYIHLPIQILPNLQDLDLNALLLNLHLCQSLLFLTIHNTQDLFTLIYS